MFKKNSPFLIVHKFQQPSAAAQTAANTGPPPATNPNGMNSSQNSTSDSSAKFWDNKFEYCKVYFKQQGGSITSYKLKFQPCGRTIHESNFQIMMYYHPTKPFVDTIYKKTRLRWIGFSPNAQQHTDSFKVIVLSKDSPSLVDGTIDHFDNNETEDWDNDESLYPSPNALNARSSHDDLFAMLSSMLPVANYTTSANYLLPMKSMTKKGEVSLMDCVDGSRTEDLRFMREHALVLTCMALVLRDHEVKKAQSAYGRTPYNGVTTESAAL
ncbi:hypothetical protein WICPIJ_005011 [Wickerhamomyces pijperi]|uniref:Uncharacterized protein n=1 Tax=Wickerhamomyces pijperi TaxID=599730 RepID=A0A9P8TLH5_WICPI|nr:hypothetical protein WICPIJ_005011 [Wickerhamomyces pijperi]